jgi:hypothetical protein
MSETVCNYAAIRFQPYRETGEFVNVGVVVYCPEFDFFDFKITQRRHARVKKFFPELNGAIFSASIEAMRLELQRRRNTGALFTGERINDPTVRERIEEFRCLVRRKESLLHFSDVAMTTTTDPTQAAKALFSRLVERDFARQKEYQEHVMRRRLKTWLQEWQLDGCYAVNQRVGGPEFNVRLPFVHMAGGRPLKALKPLDLAKSDTTNIYEHGDAWVSRMRRLSETGYLPGQVVFAVSFPDSGVQQKAAEKIRAELQELRIDVVPFSEKQRIRQLAEI